MYKRCQAFARRNSGSAGLLSFGFDLLTRFLFLVKLRGRGRAKLLTTTSSQGPLLHWSLVHTQSSVVMKRSCGAGGETASFAFETVVRSRSC